MTDSHDTDARLDRLLSDALHGDATGRRPEPDWNDVRSRAERASRQLWQLPALAATLIVVALVAAAVIADTGADETGVVADGRAPTTTSDPTVSTSTPGSTATTAGPADRGGTFRAGPEFGPVALPAGEALRSDEAAAVVRAASDDEFERSDVVVISMTTGEVRRTLVAGFSGVEGGVYRMVLTPDRRTVVYVVATSACTSMVEAVAADGSTEPVVLSELASAVAFSPDGTSMAIASGDECSRPTVIDVVPVAEGPSIRFEASGDEPAAVESMVFSGPRSITFIEAAGGLPGRVHLLDLDTRTSQATVADGNRQLTRLAATGGTVTALESCCDGAGSASASLVTLDGLLVTERRPVAVSDVRTVAFAGHDRAGALVLVDPAGLSVDGRIVADDISLVAP